MMEIVIFILACILAGLVGGFVGGLFGLGGGAVLVPFFLTALPWLGVSHAMSMYTAVGTSLAVIVPSSIMAARKQYKLGSLDLQLLKKWLPAVMVGIIVASILINYIPQKTLSLIFIIYLIFCVAYVIFKPLPKAGQGTQPKGLVKNIGGIFVGMMSTLLGIGGGTFTVPFYVAHNFQMKDAIAISSATGFFIALFGALLAVLNGWHHTGLPEFSLGYVDLLAFICVAPAAMLSSPVGAKLAHSMNQALLRILYISFLMLVVLYMLFVTV